VLVRVVSDACAGADDEAHDDTMRILGCYAPLVEVTTTAEVLADA
jgi:nicotinamidase-related amidase